MTKTMSKTVKAATLKANGTKPADIQGGKKSADNVTQRKLTEARDVLAGRYGKLPMRNAKGKATKEVFDWVSIFDQASGDAQEAYDKFQSAKDVYSDESKSISRLFMEVVKVAGSLEQFSTDYKNMRFVWKTTNNVKAVPQSILDAASVIKRAFKSDIDVAKATSIQSLKDAIKEKNKEDKDADIEADTNPATRDTLAKLHKLATTLEAENMLEDLAQLLHMVDDVMGQFIDSGDVTIDHEASILEQVIDADDSGADAGAVATAH